MGSRSRSITRSCTRALRHEDTGKSAYPAIVDMALMDAVHDHVQRHVGSPILAIHEERSRYVHVDIAVVPPGPQRDRFTLVTSGMAALPMYRACEHGVSSLYAELVMRLPASWPLNFSCGVPIPRDPKVNWPFFHLPELARMPHEDSTWLGVGHTTEQFEPMPGTGFMGFLLVPADRPEGMQTLRVSPRKTVDLLEVWPLYLDEIRYKLQHGAEALLELFKQKNIDGGLVCPDRPSVCPPRDATDIARRPA